MNELIHLRRLYISPEHVYVGHHGRPPGQTPMQEVGSVRCVAGRGLEGDRYFHREENHRGQVTFFSEEVFDSLCAQFAVRDKSPSVFRRNVILRGANLADWIGREFELQGVRFFGVEECRPCYWMDQAFCPGAEAALRGRGGLRARILSSGRLNLETAVPNAFSRSRGHACPS